MTQVEWDCLRDAHVKGRCNILDAKSVENFLNAMRPAHLHCTVTIENNRIVEHAPYLTSPISVPIKGGPAKDEEIAARTVLNQPRTARELVAEATRLEEARSQRRPTSKIAEDAYERSSLARRAAEECSINVVFDPSMLRSFGANSPTFLKVPERIVPLKAPPTYAQCPGCKAQVALSEYHLEDRCPHCSSVWPLDLQGKAIGVLR